MQVGPSATSVIVTAETGMLKTESAEQSTTISGDKINSLPVNFGIGAGQSAIPSFVQLTPGANIGSWNSVTVNGMPSYSFKIIFEGQESSSGLDARVSDESQPSVEAIQEFTLQTSNFAAEFGQVSGGLFNFTSRSGTNQFHGSAYTYASNEALNAGIPFTNTGKNGTHLRPAKKLYDYGFSVGGPLWLPKIYQGKNRTFFYFNLERYRDRESLYNGIHTLPTDALRSGDLSAMLTGRSLGTDFAGRNILENAIYDPGTTVTDSSGRLVRTVFPNNRIPTSLIDPVSRFWPWCRSRYAESGKQHSVCRAFLEVAADPIRQDRSQPQLGRPHVRLLVDAGHRQIERTGRPADGVVAGAGPENPQPDDSPEF